MNFRSQSGATGADIIIAATVIILTISIVSMLYVNTTLQGRNVTRTAGATRIATNVLENIEKMTYDEFCQEYGNNNVGTPWSVENTGDYADYKSTTNNTVFNTKIPQGYKLYIKGDPNYGSHTNDSEKFDLVREIKLVVTYNVGDVNEKVEFNTSKEREMVSEVNIPITNVLFSQRILNNKKSFYPIKYSENAKAYFKTTEEDSEWYNYSNKKWAMIIVSSEEESTLFDLNGKLIADSSKYKKYVWIPRFFYKTVASENKFSEFAYLTTDMAIGELGIASTNGTTLNCMTYVPKKAESILPNSEYPDMEKYTGIWIEATNQSNNESKINDNNYGKMLNESEYGPCELH